MDKLTYRQAYDKIIEAYFKDEIQPFDTAFCFCGTLSPDWLWPSPINPAKYPYTLNEYGKMERALFSPMLRYGLKHFDIGNTMSNERITELPNYEDILFDGMKEALDALKEIHLLRGENVDEDIPAFTKRQLAKAI